MNLLTETQAAIHLGITKELLFAYVRNDPKGDGRSLKTIINDGKNYFDKSELNSFDNYLKEPWGQSGEKRPPIPTYIRDYLKTEIQGKCPITGKGYPLEDAHIVDYSACLNHHHHNLIRISNEIHKKADNRVVPKQVLVEKKQQLIGTLKQRLLQEDKGYKSSYAPPNPNYFFVGRVEELLNLTEAMEFNRMVVVQGIGGIGKTQLLLNGINSVQYHQPVIWIDAEAISSVNDLILVISNAFREVLGQDIKGSLVDSIRGIQLTIAIDSIETVLIAQRDETEDFIHALITQTDGIKLLITSQIDLSIFQDEKVVINLSGINDASSKDILLDQIGNQYEIPNEKLEWLVNFCEGHPLSLKIVSSLLQFYKSGAGVTEMLHKHDTLKQPMRRKHNKGNALSVCLDTVYEALNESQKKLLHIGKFYPGGVKLMLLKDDFKNLYEDVSVLQQFFLTRMVKDSLDNERYSVSNPVQKFMFDKANTESEDRGVILQKEQLTGIMVEAAFIDMHYFETNENGSISLGIIRMESELPNILNAHRIAQKMIFLSKKNGKKEEELEYLNIIVGLAGALGKYCFIRGRFDYGTMFSKAGIEANVALGNVDLASTQYMYLAQLQVRQYDQDSFYRTCQELCELAQKTENDQANRDSKWLQGKLAHNQGDFHAAISLFEEAKNLSNIGNKEVNGENDFDLVDNSMIGNIAILDSEIANAYYSLGDHENAIKGYTNAIKNQEIINDEINIYSCYHQLANCLTRSEDLQGLEYYFKAIEGFRRTGQFEYLANSISELGRFVLERPDLASHQLIDSETIEYALSSLSYQINDFINREQNGSHENLNPDSIPFELLGKGILLMKLVSFSDFSHLLYDWAEEFHGKFEPNSGPSYFTAFLKISHVVGAVGKGYHISSTETKENMMKHLLQGTLLLNGGPDLKSQTLIFYWLAAWIKHKNIDENASAEKLIKTAWDSFND